MRAQTMLELSPLVTAMKTSPLMPASSRMSDRTRADEGLAFKALVECSKAAGFLSMMATEKLR